jgi:glycosyltransferase involved in cell wall biosynthesis
VEKNEKRNRTQLLFFQYSGNESVAHMGGLATFINETTNYFFKEAKQLKATQNFKIYSGRFFFRFNNILELFHRVPRKILSILDIYFKLDLSIKLLNFRLQFCEWVLAKNQFSNRTIVFHQMNPFVPLPLAVIFLKLLGNVKVVTSMIDFLDIDHPEMVQKNQLRERELIRQFFFRNSTKLIAISDFVSRQCLELMGDRVLNIQTIHWGADHSFLSIVPRHFENCAVPKAHLPIALLPAKAWKHKGHLEMLRIFLDEVKPKYQLLFIGDTSTIEEDVKNLVKQNPKNSHLFKIEGFVHDSKRNDYFNSADMILMPSIYEGFGFPYFEASLAKKPLYCFGTKAYLEYFGKIGNPGLSQINDYQDLHEKMQNFEITEHLESIASRYKIVTDLTWEKSNRLLYEAIYNLDSRKE